MHTNSTLTDSWSMRWKVVNLPRFQALRNQLSSPTWTIWNNYFSRFFIDCRRKWNWTGCHCQKMLTECKNYIVICIPIYIHTCLRGCEERGLPFLLLLGFDLFVKRGCDSKEEHVRRKRNHIVDIWRIVMNGIIYSNINFRCEHECYKNEQDSLF